MPLVTLCIAAVQEGKVLVLDIPPTPVRLKFTPHTTSVVGFYYRGWSAQRIWNTTKHTSESWLGPGCKHPARGLHVAYRFSPPPSQPGFVNVKLQYFEMFQLFTSRRILALSMSSVATSLYGCLTIVYLTYCLFHQFPKYWCNKRKRARATNVYQNWFQLVTCPDILGGRIHWQFLSLCACAMIKSLFGPIWSRYGEYQDCIIC